MAFGTGTVNSFGGAVADILGGQATAKSLKLKASGDLAEAQNYSAASDLAYENMQFTKESTAVKQMQTQRQIYLGLGTTTADVAGAGFSMSGSALDIMREGAQQGALTQQLLGRQGLITEEGYNEQGDAYKRMAATARDTAAAEEGMASDAERNGWITGGIKAAAGIASLFTGGPAGGAGLSSLAATIGL